MPAILPRLGSEPDEDDSRRNALVRNDGCPLLDIGDACGAGASTFLALSDEGDPALADR